MGTILGQIDFLKMLPQHMERQPGFTVVTDAPTAQIAIRDGHLAYRGDRSIALDGALHETSDLALRLGVETKMPSANLALAAMEHWGADAPRHFLGDYAAVVHDAKARAVHLWRDHIGTRPLYWHWKSGRLTVATLLADLIAMLPESPAPDESAIAAFLRWPTAIAPRTLLRGVRSLLPGHMLAVDANGPREIRWWRPEEVPAISFSRHEDYAGALRSLTEQAIADRLPEDIPVGAHFSGGIDSVAVALIAQEKLKRCDRSLVGTYCWSPPIGPDAPEMHPDDERRRISTIADATELPMRFGALTGEAFRAFIARPIEKEGVADVVDELAILEQAQNDGARVILSGWGGDEVFSAHAPGVPAWMLAQNQLGMLIQLARARGGLRRPDKMARFLWTSAVVPLLPSPLFNRFGPFDSIYRGGCYLSSELAAMPHPGEVPKTSRFTGAPIHDIRAALDMRHLSERMATWATWGASYDIEYRYPLTDRRIVEFVLGVPPDLLWGDGQSRYFARMTLKGRFKGQLAKSDPANERKRLVALRDCWRLLGREAEAGKFDGGCDWLDVALLRKDLIRGPSGKDKADFMSFARIMPAMRIWHMASRYGAAEPGKQSQRA